MWVKLLHPGSCDLNPQPPKKEMPFTPPKEVNHPNRIHIRVKVLVLPRGNGPSEHVKAKKGRRLTYLLPFPVISVWGILRLPYQAGWQAYSHSIPVWAP